MSDFFTYLTQIKITATSAFTIPIWDLQVKAEPWSGSGSTATRLFDGRSVQKIMGYRLKASFNMNMKLEGTDHATWGSFLNELATDGTLTVDFDPDNDPGTKTGTFVAEDANNAAVAVFQGHVRNRPVRISLVGSTILAARPTWLTEANPAPPVPAPTVTDIFYITDPAGTDAELRKLTV